MKSNLVKTFLVLNLLLCAAVLGFSIKMFLDREVIKARTVIHRQTITEIAQNLKWGEPLNWEEAAERKSGSFQLPDPSSMKELAAFSTATEELSEFAQTRISQLSAQFEELTKVQEELESARTILAQKVSELSDLRSRIAREENSLADGKQTIRTSETQLLELERERGSLQDQLANLDRQITNQQTLISKVSADLELRTGERDRIRELLAACRSPRNADGSVSQWHEKTARILAVEPDWNYVVINRGEVDVLPMYLEAFVHRGDDFIGKIRVMQVDRTVALAEILTDTLAPGVQLEAGDTIFF